MTSLRGSPRCSRCFAGTFEVDAGGLCSLCLYAPLPFRTVRYLWSYEREARDLIKTMKFKPSAKLCRRAGDLLNNSFEDFELLSDWDLLIPIPSSSQSLKIRGFNQCELVLERLSAQNIENAKLSNVLRHRGYAALQSTLSREKRAANVKNAFSAVSDVVKDKRILLFDDVITTGATTMAAANQLFDAGALSVDLLALACASTWRTTRQNSYRVPTRRADKH